MQSTSGQRYRTSQSGILSAQGTATITLKAVQGGVKGNASAGALLTLASTVVGVSPTAKVAPGGLVGGAPKELDDALRARVLGRIRAQKRIGTKGDYHAWTLAVGGVDRAWVFPLYGGEAGGGGGVYHRARSGTVKRLQRNYKAGWVYAKRITGGAVARGMVSIQTLKATFTNTQPAHQAWLWALTGDPTDGSTTTRNLGRARARL